VSRFIVILSGFLLVGCSSPWDGPLPQPYQSDEVIAGFTDAGRGMSRVASFDAQVLVLSRRDYVKQESDPLSRLSPVDFAVAWGDAARIDVRDGFRIQQPWRRYSWRYEKPVVREGTEPEEVAMFRESTANWHIIPGSAAVAMDIDDVDEGEVVRLRGHLVDVDLGSGRTARTSRVRTDQGDGACEIFLVEEVRRP